MHSLPTGEAVFAGSREDGFFCDIPGIFDLLDPRILGPDGSGQTGNGVDGFKGFNVLAFAIQIPVDSLTAFPYSAAFGDLATTPLPSVGAATGSNGRTGGKTGGDPRGVAGGQGTTPAMRPCRSRVPAVANPRGLVASGGTADAWRGGGIVLHSADAAAASAGRAPSGPEHRR